MVLDQQGRRSSDNSLHAETPCDRNPHKQRVYCFRSPLEPKRPSFFVLRAFETCLSVPRVSSAVVPPR